MKLLFFLLQILMLSAGFASNRADAMAGAAVFAVLCVVVVILDTRRTANNASAGRRLNTNR